MRQWKSSEIHNNVWRVQGKGRVLTAVELKNTGERPWIFLKKTKQTNKKNWK